MRPWFCGEHGAGAGFRVGFDDFKGTFQLAQLRDSSTICSRIYTWDKNGYGSRAISIISSLKFLTYLTNETPLPSTAG